METAWKTLSIVITELPAPHLDTTYHSQMLSGVIAHAMTLVPVQSH